MSRDLFISVAIAIATATATAVQRWFNLHFRSIASFIVIAVQLCLHLV